MIGGRAFDRVISLGRDCTPKYEIVMSLAKRYDPSANLDHYATMAQSAEFDSVAGGTFFFDWIITDFAALQYCLQNDFQGIFQYNNLRLIQNDTTVQDSQSNIIFHHNFTRASGKISQETIQVEFSAQARKVSYLIGKSRALLRSGRPLLFVRSTSSGSRASEKEALVPLLQKYCGHDNFHVLIIETEAAANELVDAGTVLTRAGIQARAEAPKAGEVGHNAAQWRPIMDQIHIVPPSDARSTG